MKARIMYRGQLFLSLGVIALGALFLGGAYMIPDAGGYSTVGPAAMPKAVGAALLLVGAFLLYEVLWLKGFRNHDEAAERALIVQAMVATLRSISGQFATMRRSLILPPISPFSSFGQEAGSKR